VLTDAANEIGDVVLAAQPVGRQKPWKPWPAFVVRIGDSFTGSPASAGYQ
jgi:hypothetical protein